MISGNVTMGKRMKFKAGQAPMMYGNTLGYRKGADGKPEIIPEDAVIIRFIYEKFLEGNSYNNICGIVRTKDLDNWERLPDLDTKYQQRNVVLHPEFVNGKYMMYTRPSDGFIDVGSGGGIGCALVDNITNAKIEEENIIDERKYHTIKETKNGAGAVPIKTDEGWIHIAHGVRNTAAGLRYVLYCFMTALDNPQRVIYTPGGYFLAPIDNERVGDVSNVAFCNGAIEKDGKIYIYYASSDTRLHLATTTVEKMVDYCKNTPVDGLTTHTSIDEICKLIDKNNANIIY